MAQAPSLLCLRGTLVVEGKAPDGDSIRFVPDTPALLEDLSRADRIRRSPMDGSVQLRLEGIDAPETSYAPGGQPLATAARDRLLALAGFTHIRREPGSQTVTSARPDAGVPAAVLSRLADANGRPVCFVLTGKSRDLPPDGDWVPVQPAGTLNQALLEDGSAYLTLYDSLAPPLRRQLRATARAARDAGRGVHARDATQEFTLRRQADIGPEGQLVLPKLYRRCTDYLETRTRGQTLPDWLRTTGDADRPEDDRVIVGGRIRTRLSELVEQRNATIAFSADPLDLVFIEK